jgi:hypothetical protein
MNINIAYFTTLIYFNAEKNDVINKNIILNEF